MSFLIEVGDLVKIREFAIKYNVKITNHFWPSHLMSLARSAETQRFWKSEENTFVYWFYSGLFVPPHCRFWQKNNECCLLVPEATTTTLRSGIRKSEMATTDCSLQLITQGRRTCAAILKKLLSDYNMQILSMKQIYLNLFSLQKNF